jgi:hypothetical protein
VTDVGFFFGKYEIVGACYKQHAGRQHQAEGEYAVLGLNHIGGKDTKFYTINTTEQTLLT